MTKYITLIFITYALVGCEPNGKKPSEMTTQELLKSREIKRISDIDILESAKKRGNELSTLAQKSLGAKLKSAMKSGGVPHAIEFCNLMAIPTMDSLTTTYGAEIKRVSFKNRNEKNIPNTLEAEILEAYAYNVAKELPITEAVQMMEDGYNVLYTKPIRINNPLCLNCHGTLGSQTSDSNYALIKSLYPKDSAINYKLNELRGMWSITLSKKEIIKGM